MNIKIIFNENSRAGDKYRIENIDREIKIESTFKFSHINTQSEFYILMFDLKYRQENIDGK